MARFVVITLSRGAGGREITREQVYDVARLMIGRHPGSEIHLPDLGLALHHATLSMLPDGRVQLDSPVMTIDPRAGGEVRLGDHLLQLSAREDGAVVVRVTNVAPPPPTARDERRLFTLAGIAPGKRATAWLFAGVVLALFVAWPVWSFLGSPRAHPIAGMTADGSWSPGPLSLAHAGLETNCRACHAKPFVAVTDTSCRACHAGVHDHADPRRLAAARADLPWGARLRQAVATSFGRPAGRCADCHTEHEGATATAATPQRFCADCHGALRSRLRDTRVGDAGDFATLHPQFRAAVMTSPGPSPTFTRVSLDAHPQQETGLKFPHALHLSATNAVAQMARRQGQGAALSCASCHRADGEGGFVAVSMEANCQSCHDLAFGRSDGTVRTLRHGDPAAAVAELRDFYTAHGGPMPRGLAGRRRPGDFAAAPLRAAFTAGRGGGGAERAARAAFEPGGACYDCHTVIAPAAGLQYRIAPVALPQRYLLGGWFDHRVHATAPCASCHVAAASRSARDVLMPGIAQCRTCHAGAEPHRGQVRSPCAMCHAYHQDPAGAGPTDPRRRGVDIAFGLPQVVRRPPE